ncbi:hypothetical protein [Streptomyces sp. NPDC086023]|uniref:hypothetical protein n=1 Tax=Streptomyces sp. NPDC086023 TaxID=3365746 RepID=UPI0037CDF4CD
MDRRPAVRSSTALPPPEELLGIARQVGRDYLRWRERLTASEDEGSWVQLFRAGPLGVWAVGWDRVPPGTCYLAHEDVRGAVYVARGTLLHERVRFGSAPHSTQVSAGDGFCFDETFYHRMQAAREHGPTVSVHVFAAEPPDDAAPPPGPHPAPFG